MNRYLNTQAINVLEFNGGNFIETFI